MNAQEFFRNDRFAQLLGIELLEIGEGRARTKLEISDEHLNALNIVHGGVIFTLADFTMAAAANSSEYTAVAINANVSFLKAGKRGTLFAEAIETSRNNKLATYAINVTDNDKDLIASYQGMVYRKKETK